MKKVLSYIALWLLCGTISAETTAPEAASTPSPTTYRAASTPSPTTYRAASEPSSTSYRATSTASHAPNRASVQVGVGYTNQYDTYISPLEYRGPHFSILCDHEHFLKSTVRTGSHGPQPEGAVSFQSLFDLQMHTSTPQSNNLRLYGADIHYDAGWHYNWLNIAPRLLLKAGGQVGGTLGGIYCHHSSNNPANAHAAVRFSASVGAQYALPLRHTTLTFRYQADLPLVGAAFSPDYGQSYYELSQYGYSHNICATTPFNAFSIRQLATIDIRLKHGSLTMGYKADIRQAKLNHLRQHQYAHSLMIGWTKNF